MNLSEATAKVTFLKQSANDPDIRELAEALLAVIAVIQQQAPQPPRRVGPRLPPR